jgi:hypothetical protein
MKKVLVLCDGRHSIPGVEGSVFPNAVDPLDLTPLTSIARNALENTTELDLYVTGLIVALTTVIRVCLEFGIDLTLYHYDRDSQSYYKQQMFEFETCYSCHTRSLHSIHCPHCAAG